MATFNGFDLGIVEEWSTAAAPKERQLNAYPGVDGLESLDMGARGGMTSLRGVLGGVSVGDLASIKGGMRALQIDGGAYVFIDPEGVAWVDVILVMFRPVGPRMLLAGGAGIVQRYEAEFLHID